jgi:hypothetical protein
MEFFTMKNEIDKRFLSDDNTEVRNDVEELESLYNKISIILNRNNEERREVNETSNGDMLYQMAQQDLLRSFIMCKKYLNFRY